MNMIIIIIITLYDGLENERRESSRSVSKLKENRLCSPKAQTSEVVKAIIYCS